MSAVPPSPPAVVIRRSPLAIVVFGILCIALLVATARILAPFLTPILLAAIVVTFTYRLYERLTARLRGRRNLAAVLMLAGVTLAIIVPFAILGLMLIQQATTLIETLQNADVSAIAASLRLNERVARIQQLFPWVDLNAVNADAAIVELLRKAPALAAAHGGKVLASAANLVIGFIMMLLAGFFFYTEGRTLLVELTFLSPLPDEYDREIWSKFRGVIDATFRGQFLTAFAQGAVTAVGLAIARVPGSVFWGAIAALFSLIPMVGAAAVWVPATIYLFLRAGYTGESYGWAIFLLIWGAVVVSLVDNVIRPWAMRSGTQMSAILLFFSILGGIQAFGFVGLIVGPLVFVLVTTMVHIYRSFFRSSLAQQNVVVPGESGTGPIEVV